MINIEVTQSNEIAKGPELKVDDDNLKEMALTKWLEYKLRKIILINLCGLPDLTSDHPVALTECLPPPPCVSRVDLTDGRPSLFSVYYLDGFMVVWNITMVLQFLINQISLILI